jgi:hypothetical protein
MTTPAVCEVESCGVLAVGRCLTCQRPFCRTHQGRGGAIHAPVQFVDQCTVCTAERAAEGIRRAKAEEAERVAAKEAVDRRIHAAVATLAATTKPQARKRWVGATRRWWSSRPRELYEPDTPAWPIGELRWKRTFKVEAVAHMQRETGVTAAGEIVSMEQPTNLVTELTFADSRERVAERLEALVRG